MSGHRHDGGTPGWKALRGTCPICKRDVATGPTYDTGATAGQFRLIKRHGSPPCPGVGRRVFAQDTHQP